MYKYLALYDYKYISVLKREIAKCIAELTREECVLLKVKLCLKESDC